MDKIQQHIRLLRKQKQISQKELGEKVHLCGQTITQYETGKREVTAEMMEYLLDALDARFRIQYTDVKMQVKTSAKDFFAEWSHLEKVFPQWNVLTTGGHVYVLEREFVSKQGDPILVHLTEECAVIFKAVQDEDFQNPYADKTLHDKHEEAYWEYAYDYETLIGDYSLDSKQLEWTSLAEELFDEETLTLMSVAAGRYGNAPSERHIGIGIQTYIQSLRQAKGWSQEKLAETVHVTPPCIAQYENGSRNVTANRLEEIFEAMGASLSVVSKN